MGREAKQAHPKTGLASMSRTAYAITSVSGEIFLGPSARTKMMGSDEGPLVRGYETAVG